MMRNYVVGFAYDLKNEARPYVLLIKKSRPRWQVGLLNGVGGHIDSYETEKEAMVREFSEEATLITDEEEWDYMLTLKGDDWSVDFFRLFLGENDRQKINQSTDEPLFWLPVSSIANASVVPNLRWLVPMGLYMDVNEVVLGRGR